MYCKDRVHLEKERLVLFIGSLVTPKHRAPGQNKREYENSSNVEESRVNIEQRARVCVKMDMQ